ncbi:glycosyltransferase family 39 protein [bacterium]|nr:glycosyltransferase family 39 protein [bacterium]
MTLTTALHRPVPQAHLALVAIVLLGAGLRLPGLFSESLWSDEAISVRLARLPALELIRTTAEDVHPPLYYLLLKLWMQMFGESEAALRSLSWVLGVAALPLAYRVFRRLAPDEHGLAPATTALLAFGDMHAYYSLEVRNYALVAFLGLLATDFLVTARGAVRGAHPTVAYAVVMGAALYTHYFAGFLWLAHVAWMTWERPTGGSRRLSLRRIILLASPLALFAPWSLVVLHQVRLGDMAWMAGQLVPVSPQFMFWTAGRLTYFGEAPAVCWPAVGFFAVAILPALLLGAAAALRPGPRRAAARLCLAAGPGVLLFVFIISLWKRIYLSRFFTLTTPFWFGLIVCGLWTLPRPGLRRAWLALLLVGTLYYSIDARLLPRRPQWRQAAALVLRQGPPEALVVLHAGFTQDLWNYYAPDWRGHVFPTRPLAPGQDWEAVARQIVDAAGGRPVWLILSGTGILDPAWQLEPLLLQRSRDARVYRFGGDLAVVRLGPLSGP